MAELKIMIGKKPGNSGMGEKNSSMNEQPSSDNLNKEGFNHTEHMDKMKAGIGQALDILKGLLSEEETEAQAEGESVSAPEMDKMGRAEQFASKLGLK